VDPCCAQDELPVAARAALTGAAGVAVGIAVAGDLRWPGLLEALMTVGLGGAGVAAQVGWCRAPGSAAGKTLTG